ncbi:ATP-binding protein [Streptomyces sp. ST2-7A]|uniref:AAA family ATPase n=1 Tax=Streptomyces sp. ST2-7A TaxID=2907214 RepID=UPI001F3C1C9C|nr:ATP-binding protein [Streptomyces sp. ST2-7A]MCE7083097.1 ATP-binding protein [Streptomyces sp. ST2-7A]
MKIDSGPRPIGRAGGAPGRMLRGRVVDARDLPPGGFPPSGAMPGDRVVVSGLPGSGKSTLIRRMVTEAGSRWGSPVAIDSEDVRLWWEERLPEGLPYAVYRPVARLDHFLRLERALRSGAGVLVHDCGRHPWVRRRLARDARRRGRGFLLLVLDVPAREALDGQIGRGRAVTGRAFARHVRSLTRLVAELEAGRTPLGCRTALLFTRGQTEWLTAPSPPVPIPSPATAPDTATPVCPDPPPAPAPAPTDAAPAARAPALSPVGPGLPV